MQPCKSGKHCLDCNKTVIDFTIKSIEELQAALNRDGKVCGRFHTSQLTPGTDQRVFSFKRVAAGVMLAIGFSSFNKELKAQSVSSDSMSRRQDTIQTEMAFGMIIETIPVYKYGGEEGMLAFIGKNLKYPSSEILNGLVVASFVVDTTGKVTEPEILKGLTAGADKEVLRVVELLEFQPGMQAGKKVPMRYTLPIRFSDDKKKKK